MSKWILKKEIEIDSAHFLRCYQGKCSNLHGHRWKVVVEIESDQLDETGMVIDFTKIKSEIMKFDHQNINGIEPFDKINPTAENMAKYFCDILDARSVTIYETPTSSVTYAKN